MRVSFNQTGAKFVGDPNNDTYLKSFAGNALSVKFGRGISIPSDLTPDSLIARGQNYNYRESYQFHPVLEWDTYFIQEIVLGLQELGTFDVQTMFHLRLNDALPTVRTLPYETEMQIIQSVGRDHPQAGLVMNVWYGARFTGRGSGMSPTGLVIDNIPGVYRYRLTGKDWKLQNPDALYPGNVQEVNMNPRNL